MMSLKMKAIISLSSVPSFTHVNGQLSPTNIRLTVVAILDCPSNDFNIFKVTFIRAPSMLLYLFNFSRLERLGILTDPKHEVDVEGDAHDDMLLPELPPTLEGYLLKGPEAASEKMFANITTKSFKRRFCKLRQDIAGSYYLDICKEDKKQEPAVSICLDDCEEVVA